METGREGEARVTLGYLASTTGKTESPLLEGEDEGGREMSFWGKIKGLVLDLVGLRCLARHPSGDSKWPGWSESGLQGEIELESGTWE